MDIVGSNPTGSCKNMKHIKSIKVQSAPKATTNKLLSGMFVATSMGRTENDALTFTRSGSALVDFFAQAGSMRKNKDAALELFQKAFAEDREKAIRILFYLRDVRGGQGERDLFRNSLEWVGLNFPDAFEKIVQHIPEYGRWDDLFYDNEACFSFIKQQLELDEATDKPSLLGKWLPTINASSQTTRAKARFMAKKFGLSDKEYRIKVRALRKKIKAVEEQMSANKWDEINYSAVPSQASRIYKNAFKKHDEERYGAFVAKAEKGEVKINAATLYPYQIYKSVQNDYSKTLEALWNQLPDYTQGNDALVIADVSGSMEGDPMSVSVSLALYFAERNKGAFKDHFITFSGNPKLQRIVGKTLLEKMNSIERSEWQMNTDLARVFELLINTALANGLTQNDMPKTLYIVSDMEFDEAVSNQTVFEEAKSVFAQHGFVLPSVVFWNVDARSGKNLPVMANEKNVAMVSGFSPTAFKMAVENKTPEEVMLDTINSDRYSRIVL